MGLILAAACCVQLVVSACGGMMGAMLSLEAKKKASSWYQAGSMGFGALSMSLLLWLSSRTSQNTLGFAAAAMIALPALSVFAAPKQVTVETGTLWPTLRRIGAEVKATFWRWEALPYIAILAFPMASGSAIGLLPGVAKQYGVGGDDVAWINGLLGGLAVAAGSAVMAMFKVRARVTVLYVTVALVNCAAMSVLWLGPMNPGTYLVGSLLYLFTVGSCYAMNTLVVLEFMGDSGKSGSGRYSILNGLANVPVVYMARVDGFGGGRWGGRGVAASEVVVGGVGALILMGYLMTAGRKMGEPVVEE
jgi:MFS transporter, PAT family, beta-lactamase induction signal transducer AmpG